jgi:hypothetical protein
MLSLPPDLDTQCGQVFENCREFIDDRLRTLFTTEGLAEFAVDLPSKNMQGTRAYVSRVKLFLLENNLRNGPPLILPFLDALLRNYTPHDELYGKLEDLYQRVRNLWQDSIPASDTYAHSEGHRSPRTPLVSNAEVLGLPTEVRVVADPASITASATPGPAVPGKSTAAPAEEGVTGFSQTLNSPNRSASRYDFFIAYATPNRQQAQELCWFLQDHSCEVFLDVKDLSPGALWPPALREALEASRAFLVLVSTHVDSAFYQQEEIARAIQLARDKPSTYTVIPVILEKLPQGSASMPYGTFSIQTLDATRPGGLKRVADELVVWLRDPQLDAKQPKVADAMIEAADPMSEADGMVQEAAILSMEIASQLIPTNQKLSAEGYDEEFRLWSQAQRDLVGYWVALVYFGSTRTTAKEYSLAQIKEYSLAQIDPLQGTLGRFIYRGAGRAMNSEKDVDFCWYAREASVHRGDRQYRFVFYTDPEGILIPPQGKNRIKCNIGLIGYENFSRRVGNGRFFDFPWSGSTAKMKRMILSRYDHLEKDEITFFNDFFDYSFRDEYRKRMKQLLLKVQNSIQ